MDLGHWNENIIILPKFSSLAALTTSSAASDENFRQHWNGVIMGAMASQTTSLTIVYSTVYSGADQRKHHSSASLAFVRGIHRWPVNSPHKWPVTRKMFPFDDVIVNEDIFVSVVGSPYPVVVESEPKDAEGQKIGVLVSTGIAQSCNEPLINSLPP